MDGSGGEAEEGLFTDPFQLKFPSLKLLGKLPKILVKSSFP